MTNPAQEIKLGQVWRDNDPRMHDRTGTIVEMGDHRVRISWKGERLPSTGLPRSTWVKRSRLNGTRHGYSRAKDVENQ